MANSDLEKRKKIPGFYSKDIMALKDFAAWAKAEADIRFEKQGGYYALKKSPVSDEKEQCDSFESAFSVIDHKQPVFKKAPAMLRAVFFLVNGKAQKKLNDLATNLEIKSYRHLIHSADSTVVEALDEGSQACALKLCFSFITKSGELHGPSRLDNYRSKSPYMLQAQRCLLEGQMELQIMPILPVFEAKDMPNSSYAFRALMKKLVEGTCYEVPRSVNYAVCLLPEGGVKFFDPANMPYKEGYIKLSAEDRELQEKYAEDTMRERLDAWVFLAS